MNEYGWIVRIFGFILLLVIFSETLGPEEFGPAQAGKSVSPPPPPPRPAAKPPGSLKPQFPIRDGAVIDEEAFIASFRRQSPTQVTPCLRSWRATPSSMMVSAVLTRSGRIEHFKMMDTSTEVPACLAGAIAGLNFAPLVAGFDRPSIEIRWRIEW
jgi:hypothetical protein